MRALWLQLTSGTVVTVKGHEVRVRGLLARKAAKIENSLQSFLPANGYVTITNGRVKVLGDLLKYEQRVRNSVLAHLS